MDPRNFVRAEYKILSDPNSSQEARLSALQSLEAERRQRPLSSQRDKNVGVHAHVNSTQGVEQDMLSEPTSAHGYPTSPGGYQNFTNTEVRLDSSLTSPMGNESNFGFADRSVSPSESVFKAMSTEERRFTESCVGAIKRMNSSQGVHINTLVERFERSNSNYTVEQLYYLKTQCGVLKETFSSTAGQWVVVNPFTGKQADPATILYNQRGTDPRGTGLGKPARELEKIQQGTYWRDDRVVESEGKQLPPAQPNSDKDETKYYSTRAQRSLSSPRRGDDFMRNARIQMTKEEEKVEKMKENYQKLSRRLQTESNTWYRQKILGEMNNLKNMITSTVSSINDKKNKKNKPKYSTQSYADKVTDINPNDNDKLHQESLEEKNSYNRHLSLLDECRNIMRFSDSGWS